LKSLLDLTGRIVRTGHFRVGYRSEEEDLHRGKLCSKLKFRKRGGSHVDIAICEDKNALEAALNMLIICFASKRLMRNKESNPARLNQASYQALVY
jgi:hypothetical protein